MNVCPNDGSPLTPSVCQDIYDCPKGCVISAYILACFQSGVKPRSCLDISKP